MTDVLYRYQYDRRNGSGTRSRRTHDNLGELLTLDRSLHLAIAEHLDDLVRDLSLQRHLHDSERIRMAGVARSEIVDGDCGIAVLIAR